MNLHSLNLQIQDIFTKICQQNQWGLAIEKSSSRRINSSKSYMELITIMPTEPFLSEEDALKNDQRLERYNIQDFRQLCSQIDFFKPHPDFDLSMDRLKTITILVDLLKIETFSRIQKMEFLFPNDGLRNWDNLLKLIEYVDIPVEQTKVIFSQCVLNPSNRELDDICEALPRKLKDKKDLNEVFSHFFLNHLNFLQKDIKKIQFMETFVNRNLLDFKKDYVSYFSKDDDDNELFSSHNENFHILYLNKEKLIKNYILVFNKTTQSTDYQDLLDNIVGFMNKTPSKKLLKINNIYLNGHQQKNENFIITIEKSKDFSSDLIEEFFKNTLQQATEISKEMLENDNTKSLKYVMVEKYTSILKKTILENSLPMKGNLSSVKLKI